MNRRQILRLITTAASAALLFIAGCSDVKTIFRKLKGRLITRPELPPLEERFVAGLPDGGEQVSVETALNSRCTSDYDGRQEIFHWGLFDPKAKIETGFLKNLSEQVNSLPIFNQTAASMVRDDSIFTFVVEQKLSGRQFDISMILSGVQQQLVGLVCAARGVGYVFKNLGVDGRAISQTHWGNVKIKVAPMKASYGETYWTNDAPGPERQWVSGNLPDPKRNGSTPLLDAINKMRMDNPEGREITSIEDIGQLLWAARGRTPHLYLSKPWGMTIPTYRGEQSISHITIHDQTSGYYYVNWLRGRPTHLLDGIEPLGGGAINLVSRDIHFNLYIVIHRNEENHRALWEIGYQ